MKIYKCDDCGNETDHPVTLKKEQNSEVMVWGYSGTTYHICTECWDELEWDAIVTLSDSSD